jgi:hypothetical protein
MRRARRVREEDAGTCLRSSLSESGPRRPAESPRSCSDSPRLSLVCQRSERGRAAPEQLNPSILLKERYHCNRGRRRA